jgi:hypothetical protein
VISGRGIPLEDIQWMGNGVPMPAYGVTLDNPDFYEAHPDIAPIVRCFGICPGAEPDYIDVPDGAYTAGRIIAADLDKHADERYRQMGWLMQWLFSCSGNSSIDCDDEMMAEFQPLSWEQDELAFAIDIIEEANAIMVDALAGLAFLTDHPELLKALQRNVRRSYKAIDGQNGKRDDPAIRLTWPITHPRKVAQHNEG